MQIQVKVVIGTVAFMLTMMLLGMVALQEPARMAAASEAELGRSIENGAVLFNEHCAACHGSDGLGREGGDCGTDDEICVGANLLCALRLTPATSSNTRALPPFSRLHWCFSILQPVHNPAPQLLY